MVSLKEQIENDLDSVFFDTDEFARTVTYDGVDISVIFTHKKDPEKLSDSLREEGELRVKVSDVPTPAYRDPVVIDGNTWRMMEIVEGGEYTWKLKIAKDERPTW